MGDEVATVAGAAEEEGAVGVVLQALAAEVAVDDRFIHAFYSSS